VWSEEEWERVAVDGEEQRSEVGKCRLGLLLIVPPRDNLDWQPHSASACHVTSGTSPRDNAWQYDTHCGLVDNVKTAAA